MRKNQFWPCVVVAGDRLALVPRRGAVFVITISIWLGVCLIGKELLPAFFIALAGVGISIDCGARGVLALQWNLQFPSAPGNGPVSAE
ncbi:hypothetical protein ILP97_15245 [Amycolatopsis sp. H6(2020)]|nr:hypothetical protein [Amycolatopsis sp. H6(2020)]